jgi:hypothetical protein
MIQLEGPLEVTERLAGMGSWAAHQVEARTQVQTSRKVPVTILETTGRSTLREVHLQKDRGTLDKQPLGARRW